MTWYEFVAILVGIAAGGFAAERLEKWIQSNKRPRDECRKAQEED